MDEGHGGTLIRQKKFWFGEKIFARSTEAQTDVCNLRVQIDRGLSLDKHFSFHQPHMFVSDTKIFKIKPYFPFRQFLNLTQMGEGKINFEEY